MGNSSSSSGRGHQDDLVDYGHLTPQGVYTGVRDWNHAIVSQLICARKLAPFYRPLEDYDESWDDDQILAARKELPQDPDSYHPDSITRIEASLSNNSRLINKKPASLKEPSKPEAAVYRGAVECPICFLVRHSSRTSSAPRMDIHAFHHFSIILQTSTVPDAVTRTFVPNALSR